MSKFLLNLDSRDVSFFGGVSLIFAGVVLIDWALLLVALGGLLAYTSYFEVSRESAEPTNKR